MGQTEGDAGLSSSQAGLEWDFAIALCRHNLEFSPGCASRSQGKVVQEDLEQRDPGGICVTLTDKAIFSPQNKLQHSGLAHSSRRTERYHIMCTHFPTRCRQKTFVSLLQRFAIGLILEVEVTSHLAGDI